MCSIAAPFLRIQNYCISYSSGEAETDCEGGRWAYEIDNNAAARALWTVALKRKDYVFCGSGAGASVRPQSKPDLTCRLNATRPKFVKSWW